MRRLITGIGLLIVIILAAGGVMAQDETPEATDLPEAGLTGVTWQWVHFADGQREMRILSPNYTITFADEGTFYSRVDCNSMRGTYSVEEGTISITPGPSTLVACPPGSLDREFVDFLSRAAIYSFTDDGDLLIELPIDSGTLTFSAQPQVTGTLTYRERMALPPDAVVRVQIEDVSIADAPSQQIGEQVFTTDGRQVPFSFSVSYPESAIDERRRYSVSARITDGQGRLLFITDTIVPVITDGNPTSDIELRLVRVGS